MQHQQQQQIRAIKRFLHKTPYIYSKRKSKRPYLSLLAFAVITPGFVFLWPLFAIASACIVCRHVWWIIYASSRSTTLLLDGFVSLAVVFASFVSYGNGGYLAAFTCLVFPFPLFTLDPKDGYSTLFGAISRIAQLCYILYQAPPTTVTRGTYAYGKHKKKSKPAPTPTYYAYIQSSHDLSWRPLESK